MPRYTKLQPFGLQLGITNGNTAECAQASHLIGGIDAGALLADKIQNKICGYHNKTE